MAWAQVFLGFPRAKDSWIGIAEGLAGLSELARRDEDHRRAAQLARGYVPGMTERVELDRIVAEARAQLTDPSLEVAWAEEQALSLDETVRLALSRQ